MIEAPPIVRRGDQISAGADNPRHFQDSFVQGMQPGRYANFQNQIEGIVGEPQVMDIAGCW